MKIIQFDRINKLHDIQIILNNHSNDLYGIDTRDIDKEVKNNPEKIFLGFKIFQFRTKPISVTKTLMKAK